MSVWLSGVPTASIPLSEDEIQDLSQEATVELSRARRAAGLDASAGIDFGEAFTVRETDQSVIVEPSNPRFIGESGYIIDKETGSVSQNQAPRWSEDRALDKLSSVGVASNGGLPDPSGFASVTSEFNDASELVDSDRSFIVGKGDSFNISIYQSDDREETDAPSVSVKKDDYWTFLRSITSLDPEKLRESGPDIFEPETELIEDQQNSQRRRELTNQLDETLEEQGYDPEKWHTGATAEGEIILQDKETGEQKTFQLDNMVVNENTTTSGGPDGISITSGPEESAEETAKPAIEFIKENRVLIGAVASVATIAGVLGGVIK